MGPSQITRLNRQRLYRRHRHAARTIDRVKCRRICKRRWPICKLPAGYYWDWGINQKRQAEEFGGMGLAVLLAIALDLYAARLPVRIVHPPADRALFSVPLAVTGVILALFLTGRSLGLTAFIGILMLVGIVVKNGILLVDYTNTLRHAGIERDEALLTAAPTRLRPILMTASAAMLGMFPIALGIGQRLGDPGADGHRGHRRVDDLDGVDAVRGADRLHDVGRHYEST